MSLRMPLWMGSSHAARGVPQFRALAWTGQSSRLHMKNLFNQNVNKFLNLKIQLFKEYHQHLSQDFGLDYPCRLLIWENRFLLSNLMKDGLYKINKLGMPTMNSFVSLALKCGLV